MAEEYGKTIRTFKNVEWFFVGEESVKKRFFQRFLRRKARDGEMLVTDRGIVLRRRGDGVLWIPYTNIPELKPVKKARAHLLFAGYSIFTILYSIVDPLGESPHIFDAIIFILALLGALGTFFGIKTFLASKGLKIHMVSGETLQVLLFHGGESTEAIKLIKENINKTYGLIS